MIKDEMKVSIIITMLCFAVMVSGCQKDDDKCEVKFDKQGTITGPDYRKCVCCGGWMIKFSDRDDNGELYIRHTNFYELPAGSTIDLTNATFPIPVKFNYHETNNSCRVIVIEKIELD
jgi:hypothetical protein